MLPPVGVCKMENRSKELFKRICGEMVLPNMIILGAAISSCGVDALYGTHRVQRTVIEEHLLDCLLRATIQNFILNDRVWDSLGALGKTSAGPRRDPEASSGHDAFGFRVEIQAFRAIMYVA